VLPNMVETETSHSLSRNHSRGRHMSMSRSSHILHEQTAERFTQRAIEAVRREQDHQEREQRKKSLARNCCICRGPSNSTAFEHKLTELVDAKKAKCAQQRLKEVRLNH
jgi:hypothetical protein